MLHHRHLLYYYPNLLYYYSHLLHHYSYMLHYYHLLLYFKLGPSFRFTDSFEPEPEPRTNLRSPNSNSRKA